MRDVNNPLIKRNKDMNPQDFNHRITLIIRSDLETWQALNTASHLSAYFGNVLKERFGTAPFFTTEDGVELPRNTQFPIVILEASPEALKAFATKVHQENDIEKMFFIKEMIDTTNDDKIEALVSLQSEQEITYLGIGLFGDNKIIKKLTNAFKLWGSVQAA